MDSEDVRIVISSTVKTLKLSCFEVCSVCSKSFNTPSLLDDHVQSAHTNDANIQSAYTAVDDVQSALILSDSCKVEQAATTTNGCLVAQSCKVCSQSFFASFDLRHHILTNHSDVYIDEHSLVEVNQNHHIDGDITATHSCVSCQKIFSNDYLLRKHTKKMHGMSPAPVKKRIIGSSAPHKICSVCNKSYQSNFFLRKHIQTAHIDVDVNDICPLKKKRRTVETVSKLHCPTCDKLFVSSDTLRNHRRIIHGHRTTPDVRRACKTSPTGSPRCTGVVLKTCPLCGKSYQGTFYLRKHIGSAHPDVDVDEVCPLKKIKRAAEVMLRDSVSYSCARCSKVFYSKGGLQGHLEKVHGLSSDRTTKKRIASTVCPVCNKPFGSYFYVRKHIQKLHADVNVDDVCPLKRDTCLALLSQTSTPSLNFRSYTCKHCPRTFLSKGALQRHAQKRHDDKSEVGRARRAKGTVEKPYVCSTCSKCFISGSSLKRHLKDVHEDGLAIESIRKKESKIICPVCFLRLSDIADVEDASKKRFTIEDLVAHLNDSHDEQLTFEHWTFETELDFSRWLTQIQTDVSCMFQRRVQGDPTRQNYVRFYCSRSGSRYDQHVGARKRRLKVQGIAKVGYTCPAHLVVDRTSDVEIRVKYLSTHYCHSNVYEQLGHLRVSQADRDWLTELLSTVTPLEVVLERVLNEGDGRLERDHVITWKDLTDIRRSLRAKQYIQDDPEVTTDWVSQQTINDLDDDVIADGASDYFVDDLDSPILLYKKQGTVELDMYPHGDMDDEAFSRYWDEKDFIFGLMDDSQRRVLCNHGNDASSVVCVHSTHTTNPKQTCYGTSIKRSVEFHLLTLMVMDTSRRAVPVAFLYSNKHTEATFVVFLQAVRARVGPVKCGTLLSDITPQFYNAWRTVMGECPHHLYYSWHVDKSFRENTRRLIKSNDELPTTVYKQLRCLLGEQDVGTFEETIESFVQELLDDPTTAAFAKFFSSHYLRCTRAWAYCYRAHLGLDTETHAERMHGIVRHVYQEGKKRRNLDGAIASLITGLCNVNFENHASELTTRHAESLGMEEEVITTETVVGREWMVIRDNEVYTVRRVLDAPCPCGVQCAECRACSDMYLCTCADSAEYRNMCAHIHLICMTFDSLGAPVAESDTDCRLVDCNNGDCIVEDIDVEMYLEKEEYDVSILSNCGVGRSSGNMLMVN